MSATAAPVVPAPRRAPRRLSPSALEKFVGCPKAFAYQYIEKAEGEDRPSPILVIGNAVHGALDKFFGLPAQPDVRTLANLHLALRAVWPQHRNDEAFLDSLEEADAGRSALQMLSEYAERQPEDLLATPREREGWARLRLGDYNLFGRLDRIDVLDNGQVVIRDWKTGRRALTAKQVPENLAAQIYCLSVADKFRGAPLTFRLEYLALGRTVNWSPSPEQLSEAKVRLLEMIDGIQDLDYDGGEFVATPGPACQYCNHAHICPDKNRVSLDSLVVSDEVPF
jgi:RecB family exonuclease